MLEQKVKTIWCSKNREHYEKLGYAYTGNATELIVDAKDLPRRSSKIVKFKCDICGCEFEAGFSQTKNCLHSCSNPKCRKRRKEMQCEIKYGKGITHTSKLQSVKDKLHETINNRTEEEQNQINQNIRNAMSNFSPEKKQKMKEKQLETFSKRTPEQKLMSLEKAKKTYKEKTGYEFGMQNPQVRKKVNETNIKKYGVPWQTQRKDFFKKRRQTLFDNESNVAASKQQKRLCASLHGRLNFEIEKKGKPYWLDIAFPDEKVYLELDGAGHFAFGNENEAKQKERFDFMNKKGWRMIRFIVHNKTKDDQLIDMFGKCFQYVKSKNSDIVVDFCNSIAFDFNTKEKLGDFLCSKD